jgi:hypothetical protein
LVAFITFSGLAGREPSEQLYTLGLQDRWLDTPDQPTQQETAAWLRNDCTDAMFARQCFAALPVFLMALSSVAVLAWRLFFLISFFG